MGAAGGLAQPLGVAQPLALAGQLGLLGRVGRDLLDLGELVAVEVEVALPRAVALAQLGQLRREPSALAVRLAVALAPLQLRLGPAKPSSTSICAEAIVSRRCSCWP